VLARLDGASRYAAPAPHQPDRSDFSPEIMSLQRKIKTALDETRLLILGAQILFGFQFNGAFQQKFEQLPASSRFMHCIALLVIMAAVGLLIAPSIRHRIVEAGEESDEVLASATFFAGAALLPLSAGLGLDLYVTLNRIYGKAVGLLSAGAFCGLAIVLWYGLELVIRQRVRTMTKSEKRQSTPLSTKVDQLLIEARVIIPGAQALLGFQFAVTLTEAFEKLPAEAKLAHVAALLCVALAVILLMTPAALHRLAFGGEDAAEFVRLGSGFVIAAPLPLAVGIALDTYVAALRALQSAQGASLVSVLALFLLLGLWYAYPFWRRARNV
jgi:hypothetical protein